MQMPNINRFQTTRDTQFAPFAVVAMPLAMREWLEAEGVTEACPGRALVRMRKSGALFVIDMPLWMRGGRWDDVVITRPR